MRKLFEVLHRTRGYYSATIAGQHYKLDPYHLKFWRKAARGRWEPNTFKILSTLLDKNSVYCDIGAWIGPTVLHAARICKHVYCFEPDPNAYRYLCWNVSLNDMQNVSTFSVALGDRPSVAKMSSFGSSLGDSMSSFIDKDPQGQTVDVLKLPWDIFLEASGLERIDLMKIDIEGWEFVLLPAIRDYLAETRPALYLSTHAGYLDAADRLPAMEKLIEVLSPYSVCLTDNLEEIDKNDLLSDEAVNGFKSYVLKA
jgi:FkbM family methyltransferase